MSLRLVAGTAHRPLAVAIADVLGTEVAPAEVERFPDGEIRPTVSTVRGDDVYVVQPLGPPAAEHLMELLLLLDACRRAGASRITAVVPYLAYARQDRRSRPGDAVGVHVIAEALTAAGADRLVVVDPHTPTLEAMFRIPVEAVTATDVLVSAARARLPRDPVVVAPDLGAAKLAERYASRLEAPVAVVRKTRVTGARVRAEQVVGEVAGRTAVIVDDMISTGATIEAAVGVLEAAGAAPGAHVVATHGLFSGDAVRRLSALGLGRLIVTDTLKPSGATPALEVCSIAGLLADVVGRLHPQRALDDVLVRG
jgi:ribose-phosphate pyrophosphokinase